MEPLRELGIDVSVVNAQDRFLSKLSGVTDPELKRKIDRRRIYQGFRG